MPNPLIRKLRNFEDLSRAEVEALLRACGDVRKLEPRKLIIEEGEESETVHAIFSGIGCRYKLLPDGRREILDFLVPGDFFDGDVFVVQRMDHSAGTISASTVAFLGAQQLEELTEASPRITQALRRSALVDQAILRESKINVGRRPPSSV